MHESIIKYGRLITTVVATTISIIASILITLIIVNVAGEEINLINMVGSIIAPAVIAPPIVWYIVGLLLKVHQLEKIQRELATYDELTGLMARRAFMANGNNLHNLITRNNSSLSLGYLDIDNFKQINDRYGHEGGDEVLKSFSVCINKSLRKSDLVGRIGGEEFAILMPNIGLKDALDVLNKIRLNLKTLAIDFDNNTIQYTVSIGVSVYGTNNPVDFKSLIKQSDNALYKAKRLGKDRVIEYSDHEL